ncbi:hypothetical protein BJX64DRAFT_257269 [Aspergillus heterothallicus]
MATAEKQQKNPIKQESDDEKPQLDTQRQPKQVDEDDEDYYSDEYDDDYDYSDDDYYDDDEEDDGQGDQALQTISSKDQVNRPIQNSSISRAEGSKKSIDDEEGLKLKVDVNLDIEIELKARIHGDLTLALLS